MEERIQPQVIVGRMVCFVRLVETKHASLSIHKIKKWWGSLDMEWNDVAMIEGLERGLLIKILITQRREMDVSKILSCQNNFDAPSCWFTICIAELKGKCYGMT